MNLRFRLGQASSGSVQQHFLVKTAFPAALDRISKSRSIEGIMGARIIALQRACGGDGGEGPAHGVAAVACRKTRVAGGACFVSDVFDFRANISVERDKT